MKICNHSLCTKIIKEKKSKNDKFINKKKRKTKSNINDLIFRKEYNLAFGTLLSLSSYVDIECNSGTKLKRTINSLGASKKYIIIK